MENLVKVFSTVNEVEMQMVVNLLTDSGISCVKKDEGSGEYMRLYMGTSFYAKEIYVDRQDYEKAKEIIENYQETVVEEKEKEIDEKETKQSDYKRKTIQKRIIALSILMIMFGLPVLLMIIASIISSLG